MSVSERARVSMNAAVSAALKRSMGGDSVFLRCKKACSPAHVARIKRLPSVKEVVAEDGRLRLTVEDAPKHLQSILAAAGDVEEVNVAPASLNDVFLKYTGHAIRDETPQDDMQAMVSGPGRSR